ncbi:hypothetical protein [Bradyrhizobium pachyrhizi]|uniref:hypothetical protein n=1 Tax=Bradyrhizobium pachyrhizi TaxID=280333 RepID=UPI001FDA4888|nr:hypothetical protein [Bradyrhizobium pachyrhizi]
MHKIDAKHREVIAFRLVAQSQKRAFVSVLVASAASSTYGKTAETAQVALRYGYTISAEDKSWLS